MIYYLNKGFIVEQALVSIVKKYFDELNLDNVYKNFHVSVTNEHPFAHMIIESNTRASDIFPSVVITTESEEKIPELNNVPVQVSGVQLTEEDIDNLCAVKRPRTVYNSATGTEEEIKDREGNTVYELIPGYSPVIDEYSLARLKDYVRAKGSVYGLHTRTQKRDKISVEIWSANNQLKNEIYEKLRLFLSGMLPLVLKSYKFNDVGIFDFSIRGDRSANFNLDFDTLLHGSHLSFDIDYSISQFVIDTEIEDINKEILWEVINHVKE